MSVNKTKLPLVIVVEGGDASGKDTFCHAIADIITEHFNYNVDILADLYSTEVGQDVATMFLKKYKDLDPMSTALFLYGARRELYTKRIIPATENGHVVILNRFTDTTLAYQCAGSGMDATKLSILKTLVLDDFEPTMKVFLHCDLATQQQRLNARKETDFMEVQNADFKTRINNSFFGSYLRDYLKALEFDTSIPFEDNRDKLTRSIIQAVEIHRIHEVSLAT